MPVNACGLNAAEANLARVLVIQEDNNCWGVTPATGVSRELRLTGTDISLDKTTVASNELRSDRMVSDIVETAASVGGQIEGEFSAGTYDQFMAAFLMSNWSRPMTFDAWRGNVRILDAGAATHVIIEGVDVAAYFTVGRRIKTEGFTNPANNDYWQIASVSFSGGNTVIVTTVDTGVTEGVADSTTVMDANDVIILKNTSIRAGTAGGRTFDSNGSNAFASALAAGQLVAGQKIEVSGLGYETGSFELTANPTDGETVTINDGERSLTFEFDNNSAFLRGNVGVTIAGSAAATAANLQKAIMQQLWQLKITASASVAGAIVTVRNLHPDQIDNAATTALTTDAANITVVNFAGATNSFGTFTISGVTNDVITVLEDVDTNANGGAIAVTIKGSHLRNPGRASDIIKQSFTTEIGFTDVDKYFVYRGLRVGSMGLNIASGEITTITFDLMGRDVQSPTDTSVLGSAPYTVLDTNATPVMNGTVNVGQIYKNAQPLASALQSITLSGEASLRDQPAIGTKFAAGIGVGRFNLTGEFVSYFETLEMYDHLVNHDTISLAFPMTDNTRNRYWFSVPALKILANPISPEGIDQDVTENVEWGAIRSSTYNTKMMIDRFSSWLPATS